MGWQLVEVPVEATFALRGELLRRDRTDLGLRMPDDDSPGALHLAVRDAAGEVIGVASAMPAAPEFPAPAPAWRLRQMAVAPARQGSGVGGALFDGVLARVRARGGAALWAESRDSSLGFYLAHGMVVVPGRRHVILGVAYTDVLLALG